jgi:hypothetical protein
MNDNIRTCQQSFRPRQTLTTVASLLFVACGGCAPYLTLKRDLLEKTHLAVASLEQSSVDRRHLIDELRQARIDRLNEAFDADVRNQIAPSHAWIIEHRRAYAVGIEAIERSIRQSERSLDADLANARAARAAVLQLRTLHDREASFLAAITDNRPGPLNAD